MLKVNTKVKHPSIYVEVNKNATRAVHATMNEFKNDSTKKQYIPFDTGNLAKSARVSKPRKYGNNVSANLTFNTSYARRQYYEHDTKSKWGEKAWKDNENKYDKMIKNIMGGK